MAGLNREVDVHDALHVSTNELAIRVYTNLRNRRVDNQPCYRFGLGDAVTLLA